MMKINLQTRVSIILLLKADGLINLGNKWLNSNFIYKGWK